MPTDLDLLVDDRWYLARNPDVAHARVDADPHYDSFGWHEGRDPDALFDTSWYLAHNPDVAASGMDPLVHYAMYGWHEGRDAGPGFDTGDYLLRNPDVAAAGLDPLVHYLEYGQAEGRHVDPAGLVISPPATTIIGTVGDDTLAGGSSRDRMFGLDGNDQIIGGSGNNRIYGGNGDDDLRGGNGDDLLYGGAGNDAIGSFYFFNKDAAAGSDVLYGGAGADEFDVGSLHDGGFLTAPYGQDTIADFKHGVDHILIDALFANGDGNTDNVISFDALDTNQDGALDPGDAGVSEQLVTLNGTDRLSTVIDLEQRGFGAHGDLLTVWGVTGLTTDDFFSGG